MSRSFSGGKQVIKSCRLQEIAVKFIHSKQQKMKKTFHLKDDNGKLWVEVIIVIFLKDAVATVDVLIASNNEVKLVDTRTVHFARLKSLLRFKRINKLDHDYSYWEILSMFAPWHTTWHWFYPNNPKAPSNDGGWMVQMWMCVGKNGVPLGRSSVIHCKYDIMWTAVICSTTFMFMLSCIKVWESDW